MSLSALKPGARAVIAGFATQHHDSTLAHRMMEMGLTIGAEIEVAHLAPFGGAIAVRCRGSLIALRLDDAEIVQVEVSQ